MQVVDVYEITEGVPLFVLLYEHGPGSARSRKTASDFMDSQNTMGFKIKCNVLEQKLWLILLQSNAKLIEDSFSVNKRRTESKHKLSFFVPPDPLGFHDIGTLTNDAGCIICGGVTRSRCAQCQSVSYCGKDCQSAHWKTHKPMCKSLVGGTWIPVTFSLQTDLAPYVLNLNKYTTQSDLKNAAANLKAGLPSTTEVTVPNIHGDRAFIAKIQASLPWSTAEPSISIYDRRRSFTAIVRRGVDRAAFDAMFEICRKEGYMGSKIYRWTKRTGDKTFSVCLDRTPKEDEIKW